MNGRNLGPLAKREEESRATAIDGEARMVALLFNSSPQSGEDVSLRQDEIRVEAIISRLKRDWRPISYNSTSMEFSMISSSGVCLEQRAIKLRIQ